LKKGLKIEKPTIGRRIAIGDIHGCFKTFKSLLENKIRLKKEDQLFLLGDYIDKGKRNKEVLDYILELIKNQFSVFPLMGNHEYFIIRDMEFCKIRKDKNQVKDLIESKDLLNIEGAIKNEYLNFIYQLPYYYELDNFLLVHAGLDFEEAFPLNDTSSMIYARGFKVNKEKIDNKILVHGHTPIGLEEIKKQISLCEIIGEINLDNGCVYRNRPSKAGKNLGRLCGLDLDKMELFTLKNID